MVKPQKRVSLRAKHFVYETVEANVTKPQQTFNVILTKFVEGNIHIVLFKHVCKILFVV